ncbi:hypothetical protein [Actinoplanes sp. NPDC023714]|uniref:hypothetical protein n=1 Tax=Actinoplanes sp. NPDC023714 TaxID=3154322 RepID=UPI0034112BA3
MRRRRYLGWMLPLSIVVLTLGVVGAITWLASRVMDTDPTVEEDTINARPCHATVRSISDTNTILEGDHIYLIEITVQPYGNSPEHKVTIRNPLTSVQAEKAKPGAQFSCIVDRDDPTRVEVMWSQ